MDGRARFIGPLGPACMTTEFASRVLAYARRHGLLVRIDGGVTIWLIHPDGREWLLSIKRMEELIERDCAPWERFSAAPATVKPSNPIATPTPHTKRPRAYRNGGQKRMHFGKPKPWQQRRSEYLAEVGRVEAGKTASGKRVEKPVEKLCKA